MDSSHPQASAKVGARNSFPWLGARLPSTSACAGGPGGLVTGVSLFFGGVGWYLLGLV